MNVLSVNHVTYKYNDGNKTNFRNKKLSSIATIQFKTPTFK